MEEAASDPLDLYLESIADFEPMGPEECLEDHEALAKTGSRAEADARERLVEAHLTMVYQLALTFTSRNPEVGALALIQAGNEALLQAASEHSPTGDIDGTEFQAFTQRLVDETLRNAGGDDPSDGGLAGDREPRRPHPPAGTLGAERDHA